MSENPVNTLSRRTFLARSSLLAAAAAWPVVGWNAQLLPRRPIPGTGEDLPVIGLGSTKAVMQLATEGTAGLEAVLQSLLDAGGSVIDTWSRDPALDALAGEVFRKNNRLGSLFLATKVDTEGVEAGRAMIDANERNFGKAADLIQVFSMRPSGTASVVMSRPSASAATSTSETCGSRPRRAERGLNSAHQRPR